MAEQGLGALVVGGRGDNAVRGRIQYVSDICMWTGWGFVVIPFDGEPAFIVDPVWGTARARYVEWIDDLRVTHDPAREIADVLTRRGAGRERIGIAGLRDTVSTAHAEQLGAELTDIVDATDLFESVRSVKSQYEIARLEETAEIVSAVFDALAAEFRPGVLERDVLAEAHRLCRQFGCLEGCAQMNRTPFRGYTFGTDGPLERDEICVVDLEWAGPSGYWIELHRTFSFAEPPAAARLQWDMQREAFRECVVSMRAGASSDAIVDAARAVYARYGSSSDGILAYTAHGIGLDATEPPLVPGQERTLTENMVVCLHPQAHPVDTADGPWVSGIELSDNIIVTPNGGRGLSPSADRWVVL